MCSAAHGWVGLGRIVIAASSAQLSGWAADLGAAPPRVARLAINDVVPDLPVEGPVPELAERVRELQRRFFAE
jgi:tRNA(Arg) A34 adenosine deaminase TadA